MLVVAITKPVRYRWPGGEVGLVPGQPVDLPDDRARKLLEKAPGKVRLVPQPPLTIQETAVDAHESIFAVRIESPVIGEFWLCLSESESFEPGDALPVYRPSEIRALIGKGYGSEDLRAIHRAKVILNGNMCVEPLDDRKRG
jgi:hypothetical protein